MREFRKYKITLPLQQTRVDAAINITHYCIAAIWLLNGLYCKLLNQVPRHEQIVARILSEDYSGILTNLIGLSEILMSIWIISRFKQRLNAIVQICIIAIMNFIEFIYARDLLLWGSWNAVFAMMLILLIYFNEFKQWGKITNK